MRPATAGDAPAQLRLVTIPISHYCEKARWALDRAGLRYREERHIQGIHRVAARRAGGGATVPVLVTPEGAIGESREILVWADTQMEPERRLFPDAPAAHAQVDALCRRLDDGLGPCGRRLIYVHMFRQPELVFAFNDQGVPAWEDAALRCGWPLLRRFVGRALGIVPGIEAQDEAAVFSELDHVAELLADGRPYLCGESFGAADLTFAALAAPVILPTEYGVALPQLDVLQHSTAALVRRAREHPAGRHALTLFTRHRRPAPSRDMAPTVSPA